MSFFGSTASQDLHTTKIKSSLSGGIFSDFQGEEVRSYNEYRLAYEGRDEKSLRNETGIILYLIRNFPYMELFSYALMLLFGVLILFDNRSYYFIPGVLLTVYSGYFFFVLSNGLSYLDYTYPVDYLLTGAVISNGDMVLKMGLGWYLAFFTGIVAMIYSIQKPRRKYRFFKN